MALAGCATQTSPPRAPDGGSVQAPSSTGAGVQNSSRKISDLQLSSQAFNPADGGTVTLSATVETDKALNIRLWDAEGGLIRQFPVASTRRGKFSITWDGKDDEGRPVPDEAYTFTIQTTDGTYLLNPFADSGGERIDIASAQWRPEEHRIIYDLPHPCRMLVRAGLKPGPLMANIVDWKPRQAGEIREIWKGLDDTARIYIPAMPHFILTISGYTLPDASVITRGNTTQDFLSYRILCPSRVVIPIKRNAPHLHAQYGAPISNIVSPQLSASVDGGQAPPVIALREGESVNLRIALDPQRGARFQNHLYEIMFYKDGEPLMEEGRPYMPYTFPLKAKYFEKGSHIFTINVSNTANQYAVFSVAVRRE